MLRDQRALLVALREIHALHDIARFRAGMLDSISRLVPSPYTAYHEFALPTPTARVTVQWPADLVSPSDLERFEQHVRRDHPMPAHYARAPQSGPCKLSDFLTGRQYHQTGLYSDCYRPLGVEHQISVPLTTNRLVFRGMVLNRGKPDFTERERRLLDLVRPHLALASRNAAAFSNLRRRLRDSEQALDASGQGVIVADSSGRVRLRSARARHWERLYFGQTRASIRLAEPVRAWVRSCLAGLTRSGDVPATWAPLLVARGDRRLVIRLLPDLARGQIVLVMAEEQGSVTRTALEALGLSPRESDVLGWVALGKTNADTAAILGTSPRTVKKHLEHVFEKLGVETRTAASARAWELTRGFDSASSRFK